MKSQIRVYATASLLGMLALPLVRAQDEDVPGRGVARLSVVTGEVSVRRGDSGEVVTAALNAPLVELDHVVTGIAARAELQFDYSIFLRIGSEADVKLGEIGNQRYTVQLARGSVILRVLRDLEADIEIDTPSVAVRPLRKGVYRVTVSPEGRSEIAVRVGEADVFTPSGSERLRASQALRARGAASDPEFQEAQVPALDDLDLFSQRRDEELERSVSYRYVSRDVYGAEDLDAYGQWQYDQPYGWVWVPRVASGWAPYRTGRWSWLDYYGWTWVSYDPWGWAPYHYGRWYYQPAYGWCWFPGGVVNRHFWRPALVAFFGWGGSGGRSNFGHLGWVPLAPSEAFHPWYGPRSYRAYRDGRLLDERAAVFHQLRIQDAYRNARVGNAISVVDHAGFGRGQLGQAYAGSWAQFGSVSRITGPLPVAPDRGSLHWVDRRPHEAVPSVAAERSFFTRRSPAHEERVPFDEQRQKLELLTRKHAGEGVNVTGAATVPGAAGARVSPGENSNLPPHADQPSWRRFGQPPPGPAGQSAGTAGQKTETRSWRRFGDPGRSRDDSGAKAREAGAGENRDAGWRHLGGAPQGESAGGGSESRSGRGEMNGGVPVGGHVVKESGDAVREQPAWRRPVETLSEPRIAPAHQERREGRQAEHRRSEPPPPTQPDREPARIRPQEVREQHAMPPAEHRVQPIERAPHREAPSERPGGNAREGGRRGH